MNFWSYSFCYIFKGYQNAGEKYSAHVYAVCAMTLLLSCNFLSFCFFTLSDNYIGTKTFKELAVAIFFVLLSLNGLYFIKNRKYLKMTAKYRQLSNEKRRKGKLFFWIYFVITIVLLIFALWRY